MPNRRRLSITAGQQRVPCSGIPQDQADVAEYFRRRAVVSAVVVAVIAVAGAFVAPRQY
jgi:hypothetical protein